MEAYPEDLLVGVSPLVFAVNAIYEDGAGIEGVSGASVGADGGSGSPKSRTLFDRFLDAMAASLVDDDNDNNNDDIDDDGNEEFEFRTNTTNSVSLFRPDEDEMDDSSDEEVLVPSGSDLYDYGGPGGVGPDGTSGGVGGGASATRHSQRSFTFGGLGSATQPFAAFRLGGVRGMGGGGGYGYTNYGHDSSSTTTSTTTTAGYSFGMGTGLAAGAATGSTDSYAKALKFGQGFFQRARIVSVSSSHGFPPSKDPDGNQNIVYKISKAKSSLAKLKAIFSNNNNNNNNENNNTNSVLGGIMPTGWLQKHAYALPSVLLVVIQLQEQQLQQEEQNLYLLKTLRHLQYSLVPKRKCQIHLICLVKDDVTAVQAEQWSININRQILEENRREKTLQEPEHVTLLRASKDLQNSNSDGFPTSTPLRRLHRSIRDTSYNYYLQQARRTKEKLAKLLVSSTPQPSSSSSSMKPKTRVSRALASATTSTNHNSNNNNKSKHYPKEILPFTIRYCFKIAILYEFQWKHEKSLKFMATAYRHVQNYYRYLQTLTIHTWYDSINEEQQQQQQQQDYVSTKQLSSQSSKALSFTPSNISFSTAKTQDNMEEGTEVSMETASISTSTLSAAAAPVDDNTIWSKAIPPPPDDMIYQIRAVADWVNFKLLQAGFVSHTQDGLIAASEQWRRHCQLFCTKKYFFTTALSSLMTDDVVPEEEDISAAETPGTTTATADEWWYYWYQVAQQRLVMSQLLERHPPRALFDFGEDHDELLMRCCPWRAYKGVAEALLQLSIHVQKRMKDYDGHHNISVSDDNTMRAPYIGGLNGDGLYPILQEQSQINHKEKALDLLSRAIALFERDLEREKAKIAKGSGDGDNPLHDLFNAQVNVMNNRSGARLYYLAGGILLSTKKHQEAISFLEKALKHSNGWNGLQLSIRRLLIDCYEKVGAPSLLPSATRTATSSQDANNHDIDNKDQKKLSQVASSAILESYFNSKISSQKLQRAIQSFSIGEDNNTPIQWYYECSIDNCEKNVDFSSSNLPPFVYSITFPGTTHATAGDTVNASVFIQSNLDYDVIMTSMALLSLAGEIPIATQDIEIDQQGGHKRNSGKIINDGNTIVFKSKSYFQFTTQITLPKNIDEIDIDYENSYSGGSSTGNIKFSYTKSARPRTAGVTSAAGSRFLSEDRPGAKPKTGNAQWSLGFLGGKTLRCDGLRILFSPSTASTTTNITSHEKSNKMIELTIVKKKTRTIMDIIKRTPFEEDNYISCSWSRPAPLSLPRGPRCLRVLGPMSEMVVTNMTLSLTEDTAMEGTVNRILLRLQAGPIEICKDIRYQIKIENMLVTSDGKTINLSEEEPSSPSSLAEQQGGMKMDARNPKIRTPILVKRDLTSTSPFETPYGYLLPSGWSPAIGTAVTTATDSGTDNSTSAIITPEISSIKGGEATYAYFDIYRPSPLGSKSSGVVSDVEHDIEHSLCQTDFEVRVTYRQEHPPSQKQKRIKKQQQEQQQSGGNDEKNVNENNYALVSFDYNGSLMWSAPISAAFGKGLKSHHPSGNRHPTNTIYDQTNNDDDTEITIIDGERVNTRCVLQGNTHVKDIETEIVRIRFQDNPESPCSLEFVSGSEQSSSNVNNVIYQAEKEDPCRFLSHGSRFSFVYTAEAKIKPQSQPGILSLPLGIVAVDWLPRPLDIVDEDIRTKHKIDGHGPLVDTKTVPTIEFLGPTAFIDYAPFDIQFQCIPSTPIVGAPFEVAYHIKNTTSIYQKVAIVLDEQQEQVQESGSGSEESVGNNRGSSDILVCGMVKGEMSLSPSETRAFTYTAIATRAGRTYLPSLSISSTRYSSWVVDERADKARPLFVLP